MKIPFNKPYLHGRELVYIAEAVASGKISGDGLFTAKCHEFFQRRYGFERVLMTTSCTDALEMAAILLNVGPGDEVIVPAFTFVSSANAFALRGAKLVFADSDSGNPNISFSTIEPLITCKTKAIVVVHYAGVACDMAPILELAANHNIKVVEDAAQAIDSFYYNKPLGSLGDFGAFSFHETKNLISGEGGLLTINDAQYVPRAEVIREKGTNRSAFFRGEVDKYGWTDIGSSFLPSDIIAAYLFAQLENLDQIQGRRKVIWNQYFDFFKNEVEKYGISLPVVPPFATNNGHMFYLLCPSLDVRTKLIEGLRRGGVHAVFHYISLHASSYFKGKHDGRRLPNSDKFSDCLVRLPLYYELTDHQCEYVCESVLALLRKIG